MKLDRRTLVGSALFVFGYVSYTILDEVLLKKKPLTGELVSQMALFTAAVAALLGLWYLVQSYQGRKG